MITVQLSADDWHRVEDHLINNYAPDDYASDTASYLWNAIYSATWNVSMLDSPVIELDEVELALLELCGKELGIQIEARP